MADLFGDSAASVERTERTAAKARRREMISFAKLAVSRRLTAAQALRLIDLINQTSRMPCKERSAPVAPPMTAEMKRAAQALLEANLPAHVIEQLTGVTRNRLSRWLGARP